MDDNQPQRRRKPIRWWHWVIGAAFAIGLIGVLALIDSLSNDERSAQSSQTRVTKSTQWSQDARKLAREYSNLLGFKDNSDFHRFCYAESHRFHRWAQRIQKAQATAPPDVLVETGIMPGDLWQMGMDYCNNEGRDTEYTRWLKSQMKSDWLRLVN